MSPSKVSVHNLAVFDSAGVVQEYAAFAELYPGEIALINEISFDYSSPSILDIGVGAGRTVEALRGISGSYIGIEPAPGMVRRAQELHPEADLRCANVLDLAAVAPPSSFDIAFFSFNGIDYLTHEERLKALREVYRVLKPGGSFIFSTHQLSFGLEHRGFKGEIPRENLGIRNVVRAAFVNGRALIRYVANQTKVQVNKRYAILNDQAHAYALLTYYVSVEEQLHQLRECGFDSTQCSFYNPLGGKISVEELETSKLPWFYLRVVKQ